MKRIWTYHAAAFLGAFLLFQIQPMMSKTILPVFGGSYLVWGACMVFFQGMLLLGYAYAHLVQRWVGVVRYSRMHLLVLVLPLVVLPFMTTPLNDGWAERGWPLCIEVAFILFKAVGLPFLVLSTTSLVLQKWLLASDCPQRSNPYVLYSASNLGSMLALLTYPALVEPFLGLAAQERVWWAGYAVLLLLHFMCFPGRSANAGVGELTATGETTTPARLAAWFLPSVAGCAMLLAVTNVITFDIASVPLLWVLPLSVYLLSFVLTFKQRIFYPEWMGRLLPWALLVGILLHLVGLLHLALPPWLSIILHLLILFCICLNCSAKLVLSRPGNPQSLTVFYVVIAFGGLVGSGLVSWVFPLLSTSLLEYPVALALAAASVALGTGNGRAKGAAWIETAIGSGAVVLAVTVIPRAMAHVCSMWAGSASAVLIATALPVALCLRRFARRPWSLAAVLLAVAIATNWMDVGGAETTSVRRLRNFYGIYNVFDKGDERYLQHGSTLHGRQHITGPEVGTPLAYYHPSTPAAGVLMSKAFGFRQITMIGLGTGALTAYTGSGQQVIIRELDPDNIRIAETDFSYIRRARGQGVELSYVVGDGRVTLRKEPAGSVDLLIVDAFNSGSIPVHLLTVEAFEDYFRVLRPDGLVLMHVSNKFLRLGPVVYSNARMLGVSACEKSNEGNTDPDAEQTYWMALSRSARSVEILKITLGWWQAAPANLPAPWTDRYSNILGAMIPR